MKKVLFICILMTIGICALHAQISITTRDSKTITACDLSSHFTADVSGATGGSFVCNITPNYSSPWEGRSHSGKGLIIGGSIAAGVGLNIIIVTGSIVSEQTAFFGTLNQSSQNQDNAIYLCSGVLTAVGVALIITGATHSHKQRWGVVVPKRNQVGFAYNF
jgi:hypothetical protein